MKNLLVTFALVGLFTSGCTAVTPPRTNGEIVWQSDCETVDCLIDKYDEHITNNPESKGPRWDFMEGYKDTPLRVMYDNGVLTVEELNPLWAVPGVLGYAIIHEGESGDIASCEAHYLPGPMWKFLLVHELMHCQGYMERGFDPFGVLINGFQNGYTDDQKKVMKEEGVSHWYETAFYKNENKTWHDR